MVDAVVFVHGIGQQHRLRADLAEEWLAALHRGLRAIRRGDLVRRLGRGQVRMCAYGDVFLAPGAMGDAAAGVPAGDEDPLEAALLHAWLRQAAAARSEELAGPAEELLAALDAPEGPGEGAMGVGSPVRAVLARLARVPVLGTLGAGLATGLPSDLRQVPAYLRDRQGVRTEALARFDDAVGPDTRLVIGHSLGSVVAYEGLHRLVQRGDDRPHAVDTLVTLGSPIGLAAAVLDHLRPPVSEGPPPIRRWVNVADRDDVVAAHPRLNSLFVGPDDDPVVEDVEVENGDFPTVHSATRYLAQPIVATTLADILDG